MKHNRLSAALALLALQLSALTASAQTLNVAVGQVTYQFPSSMTGEMVYSDNGQTLTIADKAFAVSDITRITTDESEVDYNSVGITYDGSTASVVISGDIASTVSATVSGAHVSIAQGDVDEEVTYTLSGSSTDGELYMTGSYKATVVLNSLTLTNPNGAAINIQNGKRINIKVEGGTENTLTDGSGGDQKACFVVKGHAEFKGKGTLNVTGNTKHAIKTGEYMTVKNCTINILKAAKDGINVNEYFLMESGTINITSSTDEGIQCEVDGTSSTGETTDHEDEDSGNIYIEGGTINVLNAATEGIEAKGEMRISDGMVYVKAKDDAINSSSHMTVTGGTIVAYSTGNDGLDANGNMYIRGGNIYAICSGSPEVALDANTEGGYKLYIEGGNVVAVGGIENGSQLTQSCYQASSWNKNTWYALYNGDDLALAFKTPSSGGSGIVLSTSGTSSLLSGVTISGGSTLSLLGEMATTDATVSGGSSVSLSSYSGGNSGPGGGNQPGGGGGPGGGRR